MSEQSKINILVVDDSPTIRRSIINHLRDEYVTHEAQDGEAAWEMLESNESISLVFADMNMPVMNGMLLLQKIRTSACERIASLPVIIITGYENADAARRASYNVGATDFICKPFDSFEILSKVGSYTKLERVVPAKQHETKHDKLTGLLNESGFIEYGRRALGYAGSGNIVSSLLSMQLVGLSTVFKEHGEATTKQIIIAIARQLGDTLRDDEKIAHLGSGRFTVVLPVTNEFKANIIAIRIQKQITNLAFEKNGTAIRVKMAVGISSTDGSGGEFVFDTLRTEAKSALQMSLEDPDTRVVRFDETYENRCIEDERSSEIKREKAATKVKESRINDSELSQYLASVLTGDFKKIPANYVETMIEPLQNFLEYAYANKEIKAKKPVSVDDRKRA